MLELSYYNFFVLGFPVQLKIAQIGTIFLHLFLLKKFKLFHFISLQEY